MTLFHNEATIDMLLQHFYQNQYFVFTNSTLMLKFLQLEFICIYSTEAYLNVFINYKSN